MSAPGLLPAFRYVRARVTRNDEAGISAGNPMRYVEADAIAEPNLHFGYYWPVDEAPAIGAVVWFRVGPGDSLELVVRRDPVTHSVKCAREPFAALASGEKTHEVRVDDRDYRVGDFLELWEIEDGSSDAGGPIYTGNMLRRRITYKSEGGTWGLPIGLCVLSVAEVAP